MNLPPLSAAAERVISAAADESAALGQNFLGVEHLFMGLVHDKSLPLVEAFAKQKLDFSRFYGSLRQIGTRLQHRPWGDDLFFTPRCREVLSLAGKIAGRDGAVVVEPPHILYAILREGRSAPMRLLRAFGADV